MSWEKWVLIALSAWSVLMTISMIGKPRKPIDPSLAIAALVLQGAVVALVVFA